MQSKLVTLKNGLTIEVCGVPPKIHDAINARHPDPEPPVVETETASGSTVAMQMLDDPDYLARLAEVEAERNVLFQELYTLTALRKVEIPEDFDVEAEFGDVLRYADPDWQAREGKGGRRLDYIEYILLGDVDDYKAVENAIVELSGVDLEEVDHIEDSFRDDVEGKAA